MNFYTREIGLFIERSIDNWEFLFTKNNFCFFRRKNRHYCAIPKNDNCVTASESVSQFSFSIEDKRLFLEIASRHVIFLLRKSNKSLSDLYFFFDDILIVFDIKKTL